MRMQYGAFDAYHLLNKLGKMVLSRNVQLDNIIMLQKIVFSVRKWYEISDSYGDSDYLHSSTYEITYFFPSRHSLLHCF